MAQSREIVLMARRRLPLPPRLVDTVAVPQPAEAGVPSEPPRPPRLPRPTPLPRPKQSLRGRRAVVVVASMRGAGGARRMLAGIAGASCLVLGAMLPLLRR